MFSHENFQDIRLHLIVMRSAFILHEIVY